MSAADWTASWLWLAVIASGLYHGALHQAVVNFTGTASGKPSLFDVTANNVTIENLNMNVDLSKLRSAIIASSAGLDAITVKDNTIGAYGTPAGSYGDRNAVSVNYGGTTNYRVATGGVNSVTFTGNTVSGTGPGSYFRSGIALDEGGLTATGNTLTTINHDVLLRFAGNGANNISNNTLNGGGIELSDQNAGSGTITTPDSTPPQAPPAALAPSATTEARSAGTSVTQQATAAKPATAPAESSATPTAHIQTADKKGLTEQQLVELLLGKNGTTSPSDGTVKPFDPVDMLQEIYQQRDQEHVVAVVPEKAKVRIDQDKLRFRVSSLKPGYLYILMVGTDHKQFNLLFPNAIDADNGIAGDGELNLPRPGWAMTAAGPPGVNRFVAIVSEITVGTSLPPVLKRSIPLPSSRSKWPSESRASHVPVPAILLPARWFARPVAAALPAMARRSSRSKR